MPVQHSHQRVRLLIGQGVSQKDHPSALQALCSPVKKPRSVRKEGGALEPGGGGSVMLLICRSKAFQSSLIGPSSAAVWDETL